MKCILIIVAWLLVLTIFSCSKRKPVLTIANLKSCDSEIFVRDWEFTKPFFLDQYITNNIDSDINLFHIHDQADNIKSYNDFSELYNDPSADTAFHFNDSPFKRLKYHMDGSYIQIDSLVHNSPDKAQSCYAAAIINSDSTRDLSLIAAANNGLQIWINQKPIFYKFATDLINGYQYNIKAHLLKGDNFILVKLTHISGDWKFFLKLCSLNYANENSIGNNFSSFCNNYLISLNDSLHIKLWSPYIATTKKLSLEIRNTENKLMLKSDLLKSGVRTISLSTFPQGLYSVSLSTDSINFQQHFFYGNYKDYFIALHDSLRRVIQNSKTNNNIAVLEDRFRYLDTVPVTHDNAFERKLTNNLSELEDIYIHLKKQIEPFRDIKGLHIRAQDCPDHKADSYMIYVPNSYQPAKQIPIVVMLPHETSLRHFNFSTYVSDINRIEHIEKLANRYGFAVLWSSFKVYNHHNLTKQIINEVFKTVDDVKKDYAIDTTRLYAYGDCAGGEIALFMANRYPSYFAAVAVEGPAIPDRPDQSYINAGENAPKKDIDFDFYNTLENFLNVPVFIIHSIDDSKANIKNSEALYEGVNQLGGRVQLKKLNVKKGDNHFYFFMNLMPDNKDLTDMFKFYQNKRLTIPDTLSFSTWELKYNKAFWLTINARISEGKAAITGIMNRSDNQLNLTTSNVGSINIDLKKLNFNHKKHLVVFIDGILRFSGYATDNILQLNLKKPVISYFKKDEFTEGPQNDFFASPFLIIKGTMGSIASRKSFDCAVDTFITDWHNNFFEDTCRVKKDVDVSQADVANYNLIIIGSNTTNLFLKKLMNAIPVSVSDSSIQIGSKKYSAKNLSFLMIYPNPLNPKKYILIGSSNGQQFDSNLLKGIYFDGWSDYTVSADGVIVDNRYFGKFWK